MTLLSCAGGGSSAPVPTATPSPTATPVPTAMPLALGPPETDGGRIIEHVRVLSVEIGSRVAGSPQEARAAAYAKEQFESWGYEVELQPFPAAAPDRLRYVTLIVEAPERRELLAAAFKGSPSGEVTGALVDAGAGAEGEFPPEAAGAVVLIQRGDVLFADMARRAKEAGALAVVVANREPGRFSGDLEPPADLPFVNVDQADGETLRGMLAQAPVRVALNVRAEVTARNVIARPESGECRTVSGAHYDSVPWAAGANDNASGSGVVLELARAAASAGLTGHCFALFGAEELGLLGSGYFVSRMNEDERDGLVAYLNYDVVGSGSRPSLAAGPELFARMEAFAERNAFDFELGSEPQDFPSDSRRFLDAGIPVLVLTTPGYELIHTAEDTLDNVVPDSVDAVAALGFALLRELSEGF